ncbi:hypothetical protein GP486_004599 [Trichoglossum hirsutum]|uniref:TauD/TfdA-like domain-containing protein n=1 Tax=Trichoglossum hirsutum TaxID=265104 RepID=A0A9P8RPF9_9PEZI|nr:hypothetical protein GP486_004599 [Trichoglossum hirsutum]
MALAIPQTSAMDTTVTGPDRAWIPSNNVSPHYTQLAHVGEQKLPTGFSSHNASTIAWSGHAFEFDSSSLLTLLPTHIRELEKASDHFQALGVPMEKLSRSNFPLPTLGPILSELAKQVHSGKGFFVIRGLKPDNYSRETSMVMYVGISSYIGETRGRQDEFGNMLLHLTDLGSAVAPENERQAPYSSVSQPFHTDIGSIIGLYTLGEAAQGGESKLASSATVYNWIAKLRPDVVRLLARSDWVFDSFGQNPRYSTRPLLYHEDGKVILSFSRRPLVGSLTSPRSRDIPKLTNEQVEALNLVHFVAEEHALTIKLGKGDVMFWNNLGLLHCRNGFTDSAEHKRHLVRLWLHDENNAWPIPRELRGAWQDSYIHAGRKQHWPIEPITDREYVSTQQRASGHA